MTGGCVAPLVESGCVKVFVSSLISGYERYRAAAVEAVESLGHQVVKAEDFPALVASPQRACLAAVREADIVVLLLGVRYGAVQFSGLSATHEEYREARDSRPVLVFVESADHREALQQSFIDEVQDWSSGHIRVGYASPEQLRSGVVRALHEYELATAVGPVDEAEMLQRANLLLPLPRPGMLGVPELVLAVAGGPHQQVIRPTELEDQQLARDLQREAAFGDNPVLDSREGTRAAVRGNSLVLEQNTGSVLVDAAGSICVIQHARERDPIGMAALIEEDIAGMLGRAVHFTGWTLDRIDPLRRVSDVVVVACLSSAGYAPWRTRAEHAASPNRAMMSMGGDNTTVTLTPARRPRPALLHDTNRIVEDLVALLRRERRR
nr:hypothetical protein asmbl_5 [uncultured bacterium]